MSSAAHARAAFLCLAVALAQLPAAAIAQVTQAQVTQAQVEGTAAIGAMTRKATLHVGCALDRTRINNLAIALDITDADTLKPVFDVDPFEGPSGIGAKSHLAAGVGSTGAQLDFPATGSFGSNGAPDTSFTFSGAFTPGPAPADRARLRQAQALAAALVSGQGGLTWRVLNAKLGGPPIEAVIAISAANASTLNAAVARCLGR